MKGDRKRELVNAGVLNACEWKSRNKFDRHRMVEFFLRHGVNDYLENRLTLLREAI